MKRWKISVSDVSFSAGDAINNALPVRQYHLTRSILLLFIVSVMCFGQEREKHIPITMNDLRIVVPRDSSREVAYTNKVAGVFYTETNGVHRSAWQGWRIMSTKMMDDYGVAVDGQSLKESEAAADVFPHQLVRRYPNGIRETVTLIDSVDALVVQLDHINGKNLSTDILFSNAESASDFVTAFEDSVLVIGRRNHLERTPKENYPVWLGMIVAHSYRSTEGMGNRSGNEFSPASINSSISNHRAEIVFVTGNTRSETISLAHRVADRIPTFIEQRKRRLEDLVNRSYIRTDNTRFDKALYCAKISMDALIMNQIRKGIFAGLPWFDDYWGRDSFISLAGATLVTGNFRDAKEILYSFARWQDTNSSSTTYGRIPNLVTTSSIAYNTADGTPRFVIALMDYVRYSGDTSVVKEFWPVVKCSIEGTILYHTDSLGFLTHGDAESWMDAVGPDGAWSPRGNRANDVQALWFDQLKAGCILARMSHHDVEDVRWWELAERLSKNFRKYFVDSSRDIIYDHLRSDGSPDMQLRPNQLFTFSLLDALSDSSIEDSVLSTVTENLVYPYGIASLSQEDPNFHPYHHYSPFYVQDAAYHNGTVWTWLSGQWISLTAQHGRNPDLAFRLTENMVHQILDRGAVGTLSELLDAVPRPGENEPRLSGTFSQAWSLAEFIRNFYQDYMGINPDDTTRGIVLNPHLPATTRNAEADIYVNDGYIGLHYNRSTEADCVEFYPHQLSKELPVHVTWTFSSGRIICGDIVLHPHITVKYRLTETGVGEIIDQKEKKVIWQTVSSGRKPFGKSLTLASPQIRRGLKALNAPPFTLLTNADIKHSSASVMTMYDVSDPAGDDTGTGSYRYPATTNLKPGSLDITHFTVRSDSQNVYFLLKFKNLSDPGWHPEYGFQLTYVAIAIDKDRKRGSGQTVVGMNAHYTLDSDFAFENIIYLGGGFRVENDSGKILAEYLPVSGDEKNPLGNTQTKSIEFSVPIKILGTPTSVWRYSVLVGCQDDHGGAGIGEFRSVEKEAGEWIGGGKSNPADPNVYDVLLPIQQ